jgi:serine protease Do
MMTSRSGRECDLARSNAPKCLRRPRALGAGCAALATLLLSGAAAAPTAAVQAQDQPQATEAQNLVPEAREAAPSLPSFADMVETVSPGVVNISTSQEGAGAEGLPELPEFPPGSPFEEFFRDFFERQQPEGEPGEEAPQPVPRQRAFSLGSGFIISADGYVVTNNHVVSEADEITVVLNDGRRFDAELRGRDPKTDLALLKVDTDEDLPFVRFGDSDEIRPGDWIVAIGNPFGLGSSVTAGIVSAVNRDIQAGPYDDFLQIDAPINRGNSGGPLFGLNGEVVGVNSAIFSPSGGNVGIGFAIPANLAKPVIDALREEGEVRRGWLGVRIQSITPEIAESLGLEEPRGALVASITPESPAEQAKIEPGDVILKFNGQEVESMRELPRIVAETKIGSSAEVELFRKGETKKVEVEIGRLPDDEALMQLGEGEGEGALPPSTAEVPSVGLALSTLTPEVRERFDVREGAEGVLVVRVTADSAAAEQGMRPGDVIVEVNQEEVTTPAEVLSKVQESEGAGKKSVLFLVERQGDLQFVALPIAAG